MTLKLFAKRKATSSSPSSSNRNNEVDGSSGKKTRTVFQSDPVVEKILQRDESTWNAKERRMVKRYQERKKENSSSSSTLVPQQDCATTISVMGDGLKGTYA